MNKYLYLLENANAPTFEGFLTLLKNPKEAQTMLEMIASGRIAGKNDAQISRDVIKKYDIFKNLNEDQVNKELTKYFSLKIVNGSYKPAWWDSLLEVLFTSYYKVYESVGSFISGFISILTGIVHTGIKIFVKDNDNLKKISNMFETIDKQIKYFFGSKIDPSDPNENHIFKGIGFSLFGILLGLLIIHSSKITSIEFKKESIELGGIGNVIQKALVNTKNKIKDIIGTISEGRNTIIFLIGCFFLIPSFISFIVLCLYLMKRKGII